MSATPTMRVYFAPEMPAGRATALHLVIGRLAGCGAQGAFLGAIKPSLDLLARSEHRTLGLGETLMLTPVFGLRPRRAHQVLALASGRLQRLLWSSRHAALPD